MTPDSQVVPQSDHFRIGIDPAEVTAAYASHRRRFAATVARLDERTLAAQSRCSAWSVADVLRHGCDVDQWMQKIWAGELPFSGTFDPRVTPNESVLESRAIADTEIRDRYVASAEAMAADVEGSGPERGAPPSLTPAGAVPWWQGLLHALFDSWVHERDVLLPLGLPADARDDEVDVVLGYSLAIVPHAARLLDRHQPVDAIVCGYHVTATDGPVLVQRTSGEAGEAAVPVLTGDRPTVIDALSGRGALDDALTGDAEVVERLGVLGRYFNTPA